ncbi:hypothetical protein [Nonomuraea sp. 10N515B]|uniref:hypothetical protein n=1 Tax=Nonomuraea sp. 10N515B TaxID=3457422 RepID=UPI003FCC8F25
MESGVDDSDGVMHPGRRSPLGSTAPGRAIQAATTEPEQLRAGKAFHQEFQRTYGVDLVVPGDCEKEVHVVKARSAGREGRDVDSLPPLTGRGGRVDFVVRLKPTQDEPHGSLVLIELKSTDWDKVKHVRRLAARHAAQMFSYMGHCWELVDTDTIDSFQAAIVYPRKPTSSSITEMLATLFSADGIALYWYDEIVRG